MTLVTRPIELQGEHVRLEPLQTAHCDALCSAANDGKLWQLWYTNVPVATDMPAYIELALQAQAQGKALPFVVCLAESGQVVGTTRYCNIDAGHHRLEIGYTWYAQSVQRSALNSECKLLLLGHAFEQLECIAVEFRTHWLNQRSRTALARLGAKQDGVLRNHRIMPNGSHRDTVVFSIIRSEWPAICELLRTRLERAGMA